MGNTLSKDNQIEEMTKDFCALNMPCEECHLYKNRCHAKKYATRAYNAGYRKSTDVAEEIFAEIDKRLEALLKFYPFGGEVQDAKTFVNVHWKHIRHSIMCDYDAELKKKYTEEGK